MKKIMIPSEVICILGITILSFAVSVMTVADLGLSMIVSPAYILSEKSPLLTFGQSEYVLQAIVFVIFLFIIKKVKAVYFASFLNCMVYGLAIDLWHLLPIFRPETAPSVPIRIGLFIIGEILTAFAVALAVNTYLYPQVYDFTVKVLSRHFDIPLPKFKTAFDLSLLVLSLVMSLALFGKLVGVGIGTVIIAAVNGTLIGFFDRMIKKHIEIYPLFPKLEKKFEI